MLLDARQSVVCLALCLFASSCTAGERATVDLGSGRDPSTVGNPAQSPGDSGNAAQQDAGPCGEIVEAAKALLDSHRTCQLDADCRDEAIVSPCPAPVQCAVFVRKDTDVLWSESTKLEAQHQASCGKCAAAKCPAHETTRAYCDATKHCAGRKLPAAGATDAGSAPTPTVDASVVPVATDARVASPGTSTQSDAGSSSASPYACKVNLDCTIKDVGNCCGYYPRCANANATFAPPVCTGGQAGVCGFPSIDSCECRQNTCVSLQAGNPI